MKIPWIEVSPDSETKAQLRYMVTALSMLIQKTDRILEKEITIMASQAEIKAKLDETLEKVRGIDTRVDSIDTLMDGMRQQLIDALAAAGASQEVLDAANAVYDAASGASAKIDAVITENTPPA